jgi:Phage integrase family
VRAPARPSVPRRPVLLEQLLGVVRPEFRAEVLVFAADDPVFGGGACRVASCGRAARSQNMCQGHHLRWVDAGRPDPEVFAATTDHRWRRQRPNAACRVTGCGYGTARGGMCQLHGQRWDRAGRPELHGWLADPPTIKTPPPGVVCAVGRCDLWPQAALPLCHAHANTWKVNGRPAMDVFVRRFDEVAVTDVRDAHGRPVRLTPHQWRHTLGTRLINRDVPQEVVRRILDHDSPQMTAHYANSRELHQMSEKSLVAC